LATQLTDSARAFLDEKRFAVLATINKDGTPQLTVMWYELQGDEIMMNTAHGRLKDRNLERDARIAICVEDGQRFVTLRGTVTLNDEQEIAQADIARLSARYNGPERAGIHAELPQGTSDHATHEDRGRVGAGVLVARGSRNLPRTPNSEPTRR